MTSQEYVVEVQEEQEKTKNNNVQSSSKVKGILSIILSGAAIAGFIPLFGAIAGIVFGILAKGSKGEKLGQAGIIVGIVGVFVGAIEYLAGIILTVAAVFMFVVYCLMYVLMITAY